MLLWRFSPPFGISGSLNLYPQVALEALHVPTVWPPMLDAFSRTVVSADAKTAPVGGSELASLRGMYKMATSALTLSMP